MAAQDDARTRAELGIPAGKAIQVLPVNAGNVVGPKWRGYTVVWTGVPVRSEADFAGMPGYTITVEQHPQFTMRLQLWRQEVHIEGNPVYLERRWIPERAATEDILRRAGDARSDRDIVAAWRSARVLQFVAARRDRGRLSLEESKDWPRVVAVVEKALDYKRKYPDLKYEDIAKFYLKIGFPRLRKYLARYQKHKA